MADRLEERGKEKLVEYAAAAASDIPRRTFHDIPETIRYSNQKIGEVPDSRRDFHLDLERTCTDFRNIHIAPGHREIYTWRSSRI